MVLLALFVALWHAGGQGFDPPRLHQKNKFGSLSNVVVKGGRKIFSHPFFMHNLREFGLFGWQTGGKEV